MTQIGLLVSFLDYASVFIFALTGALVASRGQLDLVGFIFFATLTGIGGGTMRDLMLGRLPVFWVDRPELILLTAGSAVLVFVTAHLLESRYKALLWLDAMALAVAVPAGVGVALSMEVSPTVIVVMGMTTGTMGGLMRDVVSNEVPLILKQGELYITAAFAGALAAVILLQLDVARPIALLACSAVVIALRAGSMTCGWRLPVYKTRPPRDPL